MKKGEQKRIDTPGQQACQHLFGAYDFVTDEVIATPATRKNSDAFVALLDTLSQHYADDRPLFLVMDNASIHHSAISQAGFAAFEGQIVPFFLPPYCSNLNPIERFWRHLKDLVCANRLSASIEALIANVVTALENQNDPSHPDHYSICKDQ